MIERYGWAVTAVVPTSEPADTEDTHTEDTSTDDTETGTTAGGDPQPFAYTVGLTAYGYPELVIAGLPVAVAHALLNEMAGRVVTRAEPFAAGDQITDLLDGYAVVIVEGPATDQLHPGAAVGRYGPEAVQLQQIVWPDRDGRFPWDEGYLHPPQTQPLLGPPPQPPRPSSAAG
ncbi:DUF4262 domain-containing protein [Cryptosporangium phraense]|uniref:DUF4262 domain-containing protein n=1 Tax=Cryptosporangium phraense TaxID=2593070 RepID=A0A545ANC5_9ACTN|nr:DUF4262 domain-containing protein [Cryptosporangium phraense]TQS42838.1 DUF4262 domain-containing protein [Cryptosporangium phraense]